MSGNKIHRTDRYATPNACCISMSGFKPHKRKGHAAIFIGVIILAIIAAVFWNWDLIQSNTQSLSWNPSSLLENPTLQIILILAAVVIALFAYMIYKAMEPKIMRGG